MAPYKKAHREAGPHILHCPTRPSGTMQLLLGDVSSRRDQYSGQRALVDSFLWLVLRDRATSSGSVDVPGRCLAARQVQVTPGPFHPAHTHKHTHTHTHTHSHTHTHTHTHTMLDCRNPNWDYVTPWGSLTGQQRARTLPPNCLIRSSKSVEVINADEDLRH